MKNGVFGTWFLVLFFVCATTQAEPLHPRRILTKLSLKLRGHFPSPTEYTNFETQIENEPDQIESHIDAAISRFMGSENYATQVKQHHALWWGMPIRESIELATYLAVNELSHLGIFDHSYLTLNRVTANNYFRNYGIQSLDSFPSSDDLTFVRLAPQETRFRSLLDSLDFLATYVDTDTNRNRTRSSFVFQALLCQSVIPDADMAEAIPVPDDADPHGSQPDCYGCHVRLDPVARFFDQWGPPMVGTLPTYLPEQEIAGELIYRDHHSEIKRMPNTTMHEFSRSLAVSETVQRCIARQGWRFAHGISSDPDAATEDMLLSSFQERYAWNDLVRSSMKHEYFWTTAEPPPLKYNDVGQSLNVCSTCHSESGGQYPIFDVDTYPFDDDALNNMYLLKDIWREVNGEGNTEGMPPYPIPALDENSLSRLRQWIEDGAHDENNERTLDDAAITEVLGEE